MITSKRDLKKYITRMGREVAQAVLPAAVCAHIITVDEADEALTKLADLMAKANSRLSIVFDKSPKDFENKRDYDKARRAYFKEAFEKTVAEYEKGVEEIIESVNKAAAKS